MIHFSFISIFTWMQEHRTISGIFLILYHRRIGLLLAFNLLLIHSFKMVSTDKSGTPDIPSFWWKQVKDRCALFYAQCKGRRNSSQLGVRLRQTMKHGVHSENQFLIPEQYWNCLKFHKKKTKLVWVWLSKSPHQQSRLNWTWSNLNLKSSTTCKRFQPVKNFANGCLTSLRQNSFEWLAYFDLVM